MQATKAQHHPIDPHQITVKSTAGVDPAVPLVVPVATDYRDAIARAVNKDQVRSVKLHQQRLRAVRVGAHPEILRFTDLMMDRMDKVGIPVWPHAIVRSLEAQKQLKHDGFSRAGAGRSPHNFGLAVDLVHSIYAWDMSPEEWSFFGAIGKELAKQRTIAIQWGGDWPPLVRDVGWDPAHWQIKGWKQLMTGYPFK